MVLDRGPPFVSAPFLHRFCLTFRSVLFTILFVSTTSSFPRLLMVQFWPTPEPTQKRPPLPRFHGYAHPAPCPKATASSAFRFLLSAYCPPRPPSRQGSAAALRQPGSIKPNQTKSNQIKLNQGEENVCKTTRGGQAGNNSAARPRMVKCTCHSASDPNRKRKQPKTPTPLPVAQPQAESCPQPGPPHRTECRVQKGLERLRLD